MINHTIYIPIVMKQALKLKVKKQGFGSVNALIGDYIMRGIKEDGIDITEASLSWNDIKQNNDTTKSHDMIEAVKLDHLNASKSKLFIDPQEKAGFIKHTRRTFGKADPVV